MKESEAKEPKISAVWWNTKKSKSLKDVKFGSALAAYESMVKAGELENQLTQLDILMKLIDPTKRLLDPKTQKETALALDNYDFVFKKEKSLVAGKIKLIKAESTNLDKTLESILDKHTKVLTPYFVAMNKIFSTLRLIHQKTTSHKGELDEKIRIKMLEQIQTLASDTFKQESAVKQAKSAFDKDAMAWVVEFRKLPGESGDSANKRWLSHPRVKELSRFKEEFDEQVDWVRENARNISGGAALTEDKPKKK